MSNNTMTARRRVWFVLAVLAACAGQACAADTSKPNVLLFLIDDLGCRDVQVDGSTFYETPRLNGLAQSGVRFTSFYSNCPVCSPTRAALMTGKVPQRVGITDWIHPASGIALPAAEITLGEAFQSQGYQTAYVGKWHLGESDTDQPAAHGFEWVQGVNRAGQPASYYFPFRREPDKPSIWDVPDLGDGKQGDYLTDVLTSRAIDFLKQRDAQRPFLLCFGHYAVHTPIEPPADLPEKYRGAAHTTSRRFRHAHASGALRRDLPCAAGQRRLRRDDGEPGHQHRPRPRCAG